MSEPSSPKAAAGQELCDQCTEALRP